MRRLRSQIDNSRVSFESIDHAFVQRSREVHGYGWRRAGGHEEHFCEPEGEFEFGAFFEGRGRVAGEVAEGWAGEEEGAGEFLGVCEDGVEVVVGHFDFGFDFDLGVPVRRVRDACWKTRLRGVGPIFLGEWYTRILGMKEDT